MIEWSDHGWIIKGSRLYGFTITSQLTVFTAGVKSTHPDDSTGTAWVYAEIAILSTDHPGVDGVLDVHIAGATCGCKFCHLQGTRH